MMRFFSRRNALKSIAASPIALSSPLDADAVPGGIRARTEDGRWTRLRRVVTSVDSAGKSVVIADGEPSNAFELNGTRIVRLWETPSVPAKLPLLNDAGVTAANAYRPGFKGTSFYVAELPGGIRSPAIPMHHNLTVDYMAVLSGRIIFKLEDREIALAAGDTLVQGGNEHTWINRWNDPCMLLFVVITAEHLT